MKTTMIILVVLIIVSILLFYVLGFMSRSGTASGLVGGKLIQCPDKPNCVCSEYRDDSSHFIEPIEIPADKQLDYLASLKNTLIAMGGKIEAESENYIASTFSSAVFGFVDDVEIRLDMDMHVIHLRSASRVGRGDLGANKKRMNLFKKRYNDEISKSLLK